MHMLCWHTCTKTTKMTGPATPRGFTRSRNQQPLWKQSLWRALRINNMCRMPCDMLRPT